MFQSICKGVIAVSLWLGVGANISSAQPPKEITNSIGMKLMLIPKGTFMMGSPKSEEGHQENESQHEVTISNDYYLGVMEVTQGQYEKVMGINPSYFQRQIVRKSDTSMYPVDQVSWEDAVEFCKKLSDLPEDKQAGRVYRLPTEAHREYACRAVSKRAFGFGGLKETATHRRTLSVRRRQTLGAFTICTGTSGNGAATGTVNIPRVQSAIPLDHGRARAA